MPSSGIATLCRTGLMLDAINGYLGCRRPGWPGCRRPPGTIPAASTTTGPSTHRAGRRAGRSRVGQPPCRAGQEA